MLDDFARALNDDLNLASAMGSINAWITSIDEPRPVHAEAMAQIDAVLMVLALKPLASAETDIGVFTGGLSPDAAVIDLLVARRDAKKAKDFAASDRIRDELKAMGYAIKDVAGGKVEVSRG